MSASFDGMATVTASTKRKATVSGGKRSGFTVPISTMKCLPIDPIDSQTRYTFGTEIAVESKQTFCRASLDIREGDYLVVGSTNYQIIGVAEWSWIDEDFKHLLMNEVKTNLE